jgi:glycosyltransferase involved in cell wall biosynthesis
MERDGRIRVLMLLDRLTPGGGGAEVFTAGLATHLPPDRFDVRVCATRYVHGFIVDDLAHAGIPCFALGRRGRFDLLPFGKLWSYLRREGIDVLHAHLFGSNLWGTLTGSVARVPALVAHEHTWSYEGRPVRKFLDGRVIGRLASRFVAVSSLDRQRMIELEKVPPERIAVIPAAFVPRGDSSDTDLRAELGIEPGAPVIGTAIALRPQKALKVAIDAVAEVRRSRPDAHFVVAGLGPCQEAWEAHARERLGDHAHFLRARSDVPGLIRAFDVCTLSSDYEGTPVFLLESMAYGTPIAATDVGGVRDVVGDAALLVPPRDPAALARAYLELLEDPRRGRELASTARARVDDFTIERIAGRFAGLYESILDGT